jgi:hypothetical protein
MGSDKLKYITEEEYKKSFSEAAGRAETKEADTRAGRALAAALDIRKLEISLYWTRATYFWAFIATAFAGYALTYKTSLSNEPWLALLFSSLGLVFSVAWYLVNRGSKFWQCNWERHVDLLEGMTLGPLYKYIAMDTKNSFLTSPGAFSVTKINQMLGLFVSSIWLILFLKALGPVSFDRELDIFKTALVVLTVVAVILLWWKGKTNFQHAKTKIFERTFEIEKPNKANSADAKSRAVD